MAIVALGLLESVSAQLMLRWTFRLGIPVMYRRYPAPAGVTWLPAGPPPDVRVEALGPDELIFRRTGSWFDQGAGFQVRGTARLRSGQLVCVGRAPLALLAFLGLLAASLSAWWAWAVAAGLVVVVWFREDSWFDSNCAAIARVLVREP